MSTSPVVSVITIFLNAEPFLDEAIESVFTQTYDSWELLLVDDGSTDGSTTIARNWAAHHPGRVRYLCHPGHQNRGMSASRNLGIAHARGEYLAFLDGDDVWLPRKLESQVEILDSQPDAGMVYGPTQWWYSWTGNHADRDRDFVHELAVPADTLIRPPELLVRFLQAEGCSPCTCSLLVRRNVVDRVGGFEPAFRGMYEDQVFYSKLGLNVPILVSGQCWDRYRQRVDSSCSIAHRTGKARAARLEYLNWLKSYVSKQGNRHNTLERVLISEIRRARFPRWYLLYSRAQHLVRRGRNGRWRRRS